MSILSNFTHRSKSDALVFNNDFPLTLFERKILMMSLEITTETCHANLDLLIGTEILDRIVTTETVLCVQFKPPSLAA